jgi:hypothetical protein
MPSESLADRFTAAAEALEADVQQVSDLALRDCYDDRLTSSGSSRPSSLSSAASSPLQAVCSAAASVSSAPTQSEMNGVEAAAKDLSTTMSSRDMAVCCKAQHVINFCRVRQQRRTKADDESNVHYCDEHYSKVNIDADNAAADDEDDDAIDLGTVFLHPVTAAVSASKPEHAQPWTAGAGDVHDASLISNQIGRCMSECIGRSLSSSCNALMSSAWSAVHTTKMVPGANYSAPALGRIAVISYDNPLFSADL